MQDVDAYVGRRIRRRRTLLSMTQVELSAKTGILHQQISKIEHGKNRVIAKNLWKIAGALSVTPDYFFQGLPQDHDNQ